MMTTRIYANNGNTISHLSQETPLPFKKYTKKRSWVWDWFEQDPGNKYRAVCLHCHQEIFRLDGDRGSPKKLITHVNSKHNINKDNYNSREKHDVRAQKIREYLNSIGDLVTNRDDAVMLGIMPGGRDGGRTSMVVVEGSPEGDAGASSPPPQSSTTPTASSLASPSPSHPYKSASHQPTFIVGEFRPSLPVKQLSQPSTLTVPKKSLDPEPQMDTSLIDPSLAHHVPPNRSVLHQDDIDRYNDLIYAHNKQVEEYNKAVILGEKTNKCAQLPLSPVISTTKDIENSHHDNSCQKALNLFIAENSASFRNLNFLRTDSFNHLIKTLREHPDQPI